MKTLLITIFFSLLSSPTFAEKSMELNVVKRNYLSKEAIETTQFAAEVYSQDYSKILSSEIIESVRGTLSGHLPAGNDGRYKQIQSLQLKDLEMVGFRSYPLIARTGSGQYDSYNKPEKTEIIFEIYFAVPAGHGLPKSYVGVGFKTQKFKPIVAEDAQDGITGVTLFYQLPVLKAEGTKDIYLFEWSKDSAIIDYTESEKKLKDYLRHK